MTKNRIAVFSLAVAALCGSAFAANPRAVSDTFLKDSLAACTDEPKITRQPLPFPLPTGFFGELVIVESEHPGCAGQYAAITNGLGDAYVGAPWFMKDFTGTVEEKMRTFAWQRFQEPFSATVVPAETKYGLTKTIANEKTDFGVIPIEGWTDAQGLTFFPGDFYKTNADLKKERIARLAPLVSLAPSKGPADAAVSVIEFSDFQCPSCRLAASWSRPILEKYDGKIRFTRIDLPLVSHHPWALQASIAGRAVWRQKPDLFWAYKEQIYDMQGDLSAFTVEDYTRNWAKDHDLDMTRFDADVASSKTRDEILSGVGAAYALQILGTPTYLVNGVIVDAGPRGENLDKYIGSLLGAEKRASK